MLEGIFSMIDARSDLKKRFANFVADSATLTMFLKEAVDTKANISQDKLQNIKDCLDEIKEIIEKFAKNNIVWQAFTGKKVVAEFEGLMRNLSLRLQTLTAEASLRTLTSLNAFASAANNIQYCTIIQTDIKNKLDYISENMVTENGLRRILHELELSESDAETVMDDIYQEFKDDAKTKKQYIEEMNKIKKVKNILEQQKEAREFHIPFEYKCPICKTLMLEPVTIATGHTFCKPCITKHLKENDFCPLTKEPLNGVKPIPARNLSTIIHDFYERNKEIIEMLNHDELPDDLVPFRFEVKDIKDAHSLSSLPTFTKERLTFQITTNEITKTQKIAYTVPKPKPAYPPEPEGPDFDRMCSCDDYCSALMCVTMFGCFGFITLPILYCDIAKADREYKAKCKEIDDEYARNPNETRYKNETKVVRKELQFTCTDNKTNEPLIQKKVDNDKYNGVYCGSDANGFVSRYVIIDSNDLTIKQNTYHHGLSQTTEVAECKCPEYVNSAVWDGKKHVLIFTRDGYMYVYSIAKAEIVQKTVMFGGITRAVAYRDENLENEYYIVDQDVQQYVKATLIYKEDS